MKVCPHCQRCYEDSSDLCSQDRSALAAGRPGARLVARKYVLERLLEEAACQTVYAGRHTETGRPYAVKLLLPEGGADAEAAKSFRRAALTNAHLNTRVDHQHVAKTYDYGLLPDGTVYVVTEPVGGRSLRRYLDEAGPLPAATAAHIARQLADGLEAAHRQGVAHHDLDPAHILIARGDDERPEVKIVDFGFAAPRKQDAAESADGSAKNADGAAEKAGAMFAENAVGSAARVRSEVAASRYAAPEELGGQNVDARSDLYSLGAVLYEMLSGSPPPAAHKQDDGPPPVFAIRDDVPVALARLVSQLLRGRPSARPPSAAEVAKRLRVVEEMLAAGSKLTAGADVQAYAAEEPELPASSHASEETPAREETLAAEETLADEETLAGVAALHAPSSSLNQSSRDPGAHGLESDATDYEDLDALQEELGADLDGIIGAASTPANLKGQARPLTTANAPGSGSARAARPPAAGGRRSEAVGNPRVARILLTTLAAIITGVACGLWLTSRSASLPPTKIEQSDSASPAARQSETAATQGQTAATQSETTPAETPSNVETGEQAASDNPAPVDAQSPESAQGASDERAAVGVDAPSAKVAETKPDTETKSATEDEARRGATNAAVASGTAASTAPAGREVARQIEGRCVLSVSESSLSIPTSGGAGSINVNVSGGERVRASTNNWPDIAVFSESGGGGGRVRYTVISVSKRPGTFAVTFNSPCGTKTVPVTVRQR